MSKVTRGTRALDAAGVNYALHPYDYASDAEAKGMQAAAALGASPHRVLKSLMTWIDHQPVCAVIPSDRHLQLKKLAAACGGKSARMMEIADAERRTGYKVGGISPLAQQRPARIVIEQSVADEPTIFFNAGQRGLLVELSPADALSVLQATVCDLSE